MNNIAEAMTKPEVKRMFMRINNAIGDDLATICCVGITLFESSYIQSLMLGVDPKATLDLFDRAVARSRARLVEAGENPAAFLERVQKEVNK